MKSVDTILKTFNGSVAQLNKLTKANHSKMAANRSEIRRLESLNIELGQEADRAAAVADKLSDLVSK